VKTHFVFTALSSVGAKALNRGCPNYLANALHLLWTGLRAACVKITINGLPNGLNYFVIFILYTECPRMNVPDFGRVFLILKYTDVTQNTYIPS
jgi:hypothetical protein